MAASKLAKSVYRVPRKGNSMAPSRAKKAQIADVDPDSMAWKKSTDESFGRSLLCSIGPTRHRRDAIQTQLLRFRHRPTAGTSACRGAPRRPRRTGSRVDVSGGLFVMSRPLASYRYPGCTTTTNSACRAVASFARDSERAEPVTNRSHEQQVRPARLQNGCNGMALGAGESKGAAIRVPSKRMTAGDRPMVVRNDRRAWTW